MAMSIYTHAFLRIKNGLQLRRGKKQTGKNLKRAADKSIMFMPKFQKARGKLG
jgi:hypothetical protein